MNSFRALRLVALGTLSLASWCLASTVGAQAQSAPPADIAELVVVCTACHGEKGIPDDPEIPILWGQHFYYLYVQLKDYDAGRRAHEIMSPIAADLSKDQKKALAQYFSEQTWPATGYRNDRSIEATAENAIVAGACTACHLGGFVGNSRVPRVAGQQIEYIKKTLTDFKTGIRKNAPSKSALFDTTTDEEISALAQYLAGL